MNSKKFAKRMKDSGVSPVIATILMVAITVVLAAVLYVMVSGFTHSPGTANSAGLSVSNSGTSWVVSVDKVSSSNLALSSLTIEITNGTTTWTYTGAAFSTPTSPTGAPTLSFVNINSGTTLAAGDSFSFSSSAGHYIASGGTFEIVDGNSVLASITVQ